VSVFRASRIMNNPAAVPRGVRAVVVDAVKTVFRAWFASHVGEKGRVVVPIEGDAASAVVGIILPFGIEASLAGGSPRPPFWRQAISMFVVGLAKTVFCTASTRLGLPVSQVATEGNMLISTVALTAPASLAASNIGKRKYNETTKTLACEVYSNSAHRFLMAWGE
jgi:hypothetical protein